MKIRTAVWLYITALTITSVVILATTVISLNNTISIQSNWDHFELTRSEKSRALNKIHAQIGFGGMIHHYKNLILRGDNNLLSKIHSDLGGAEATISEYKYLPLNETELAAISDIESTLEKYRSALTIIRTKLVLNERARAIDNTVRIDDQPALQALGILAEELKGDLSHTESKAHTLNRLRTELGYGGMIHNYKNYLLRGESRYQQAAEGNISRAKMALNSYRKNLLVANEQSALKDIDGVIGQYKNKLSIIQQGIANGLSPREMDRQVKVDDAPLLHGLIQLDRENIAENELAASHLQQSLTSVMTSNKMIVFIVLFFFSLLALGFYWLIHYKIIRPIQTLNTVTTELALEKSDIHIPMLDKQNEIGELAASLEVFRKNILRRQHAEEQLTHINQQLEERIQDAIQAAELNAKHLENLLNNAADAIVITNIGGDILFYNKAACEIFGYTQDETIGKNVKLLMPEDDAKHHDRYINDYIATEKGKIMGLGRVLFGKHKSGLLFPIEVSLSSIQDGEQTYMTAIIRDITKQQEQEHTLRQSQKMEAIGKLTGGIAHDYNNMLGVVLGFTELLGEVVSDIPQAHTYIKQIHHAAQRGVKLTAKLLKFSRKTGMEPELVDINQLLLDQQDMLKKTLTAKIKLVMKLSGNHCLAWIDVGELEDAILNLSINAMHAMPNGGQLSFETEIVEIDSSNAELDKGHYIILSISDTGDGIPAEIQLKIFEPFFSTKDESGTGLGLSQVYGFVQRSHGHITFESQQPIGTTFYIYLPLYKETNSRPMEVAQPPIETILDGDETILVVDDEPSLLALNKDILEQHGYHVITANNGREAQALIQQRAFQLVLSDVIMPEMDGYALSAWLQSHYPDVKIQLVSGYQETETETQRLVDEELKARILKKPYSQHELLRTVRDRLDGA
ncbi:MAG: PAS domain S-box protein [Gammaproteobacteria bacterium]|nr:PAS domain S-box protein [Gammaproteobacteria bacterium]